MYNFEPTAPVKFYNTKLPKASLKMESWVSVKEYLTNRGLDWDTARYNGWYPSEEAGDSYLRIVIPSYSLQTGNKFWQARSIFGHEPRYQSPHAARGDAVTLVRQAGGAGIFLQPMKINTYIVVEGPMDALAAAGCCYNSIALMGNTPSVEVLSLTAKLLRGKMAIVIPDSDAPQALVPTLAYLASQGVQCNFLIPPAKDLADLSFEERVKLLSSGCWQSP